MHKRLGFDLFAQRFPRDIAKDHELDEEESATRSPLNYGEVAIVLPGTSGNEGRSANSFRLSMRVWPKTSGHGCLMRIRKPDSRSLSTTLMMLSIRTMI